MRFIDEAQIEIHAGHGGPGSVSFRREKFIPKGGPDGGDGGKGGNVVFVVTEQLSTLQDFRYRRAYKAPSGDHGSGANKAGRDGETIEIRIPCGTSITDVETGELVGDFQTPGERIVICEGGRGGKGNAHFVSSTFQAPKFAQPGEPGKQRTLKLELKLLADAALIGYPNAGKSTLISKISAARPKIADYAFTTLQPNLGVVEVPGKDGPPFVVADIPGLIEGAHRGQGLGHRFLKHIERTRVLVHLIDSSAFLELATRPGDNPITVENEAFEELNKRYLAVRKELELFNPDLAHKEEIVIFHKSDLLLSDPDLKHRLWKSLRMRLESNRGHPPDGQEPYFVSSATGEGLDALKAALLQILRRTGFDPEDHSKVLPDDVRIRK